MTTFFNLKRGGGAKNAEGECETRSATELPVKYDYNVFKNYLQKLRTVSRGVLHIPNSTLSSITYCVASRSQVGAVFVLYAALYYAHVDVYVTFVF